MRFTKVEVLLNILFWIFFTWLFVFSKTTMDVVGVEVVNGKEHKTWVRNPFRLYAFLLLQAIAMLIFYGQLYLIHRLKRPKAVRLFIPKSIVLFFGGLLLQLLALYLFYNFQDRVSELTDFQGLNTIMIINIVYFAAAICYGFTKKWMAHEKDKQHLQLVKNQSELKLLKQQLQPHFLFNTMNNLLAMVDQQQNPKLAGSIDKLSNLLRYVVYDTESEKVTIAQEILFIRNFAELHLLRFEEDEVDFKLDIFGEHDEQPIEPGILLCYVENAFKHGVQPEERSFVHISIDVSVKNSLKFRIENSMPAHLLDIANGGYGIKSNQERLNLAYPNRHFITFTKENTYIVELTVQTDDENNYS